MSRPRENMSSARGYMGSSSSIIFSNTIPLPNIPRMTDDKSKVRYMTEYDKYEQELRRHHLGPPETTIIMGLKDVTTDFDRSVPRINEPTTAEKEFERYLMLRNEARKRRNQFRPLVPREAKKKPRHIAMANEPRISLSQNDEATLNETDTTNTKPASVAADSEFCAAKSAKTGEAAAPVAAEAALLPKMSLSKRYVNTTRTPSFSRKNSKEKELESLDTKLREERQSPAPERKRLPRTTSRSRTPTSPQAPSAAARAMEIMLKDELNKISLVALQGKLATKPNGDSDPGLLDTDTSACSELLRVLLCPMDKYSESVNVSMEYMDLSWLKKGRQPPANIKTIQDLRLLSQDNVKGRNALPTLNSPRSVLVLLRNGVAVKDLLPIDISNEDFIQTEGEISHLASSTKSGKNSTGFLFETVQSHRLEWDKKRRAQLFSYLVEDYHQLCGQVSSSALVDAFHRPSSLHSTKSGSPSFERQRDRLQKVFDANKARMAKSMSMANVLNEQKRAREEHRLQVQAEAQAAMAQKMLKEAQAREKQRERLEAQLLKKEQMEKVVQQLLEEKLAKAAQRNKERQEAKERLYMQQHLKQAALASQRSQRFERNAETQLKIEEEVERNQIVKEAKLDYIKLAQLERLERERYEKEVAQARAAREREAVLRRIAEKQAATLEAATLRQQKAEAHLQEFRNKCEEERAARAAREEERRERRLKASARAVEINESFRLRVLEKLQQRDRAYTNQQREALLKRVVHHELEREIEAARSYAVLQKQRVKAFCKLHTIIDLMEKQKVAAQLEKLREDALEENHKINSMLSKERENLLQKMGRE